MRKEKNIGYDSSKRRFLKLLLTLPLLAPLASFIHGNDDTEEDFIVLNGWVLKKSDLINY